MQHFYLRITPGETVKIIISVSKKISKKAVIRNRIRRRVRPIIKNFIPKLRPANYFIVAKPGVEKIKGKELESELIMLIRSIRN